MILLALLIAAAQPTVDPQACETPQDVEARIHYERALRAELDGRLDEALKEAEAAHAAGPGSKFAEAADKLAERARAKGASVQPGSTGVGPRTELVITTTTAGLYLGAMYGAAAKADGKAYVALLMAGTTAGLAGSIIGTSGRRVPQSMPQMVQNGMYFGTLAGATLSALGGGSGDSTVTAIALGSTAGVALGFATAPYLTGGDSGAATTGMIYGAALPFLVYAVAEPNPSAKPSTAILLVGGTAGMIAATAYNHTMAHYSRGRWNLITLGGGVGALMGAGVGVLTDSWGHDARGGVALLGLGTLAGVALTWRLTGDFGVDEAAPGAASLLQYDGKKLRAGDVVSSVAPMQGGAYVSALSGRF